MAHSRHSYFPKDSPRRKKALKLAQARAKVSEDWHKAGNKLTPETQAEFNKLMKSVSQ